MERNFAEGITAVNITAVSNASFTLDNASKTPATGYDYIMIQTIGAFVATMTLQGSNDGTNWVTLPTLIDTSMTNSMPVSTITASGKLFVTPITTRYTRLYSTAYTSGTVAVSVMGSFGDLTTLVTNAGGFSSIHHLVSGATTNATSVKTSTGTIGSIVLANSTASVKYFKLFNKASAPTVGTDTPIMTIAIPANGSFEFLQDNGLRLSTGIAYAITGAIPDLDATAVAVSDVSVTINYA